MFISAKVCVCERERERGCSFLIFCVAEFQYAVALGFVDVMDALNMGKLLGIFGVP